MNARTMLSVTLAVTLFAGAASAQGVKRPNPFDDSAPTPPNQVYQGNQGFSFPGDELPPSHDRRQLGRYDDRYSETYRQQQAEAQKPGGGCLRYGAVGALGGHLAGHGVLGALAGCATGAIVRHRDKARIEQESGR